MVAFFFQGFISRLCRSALIFFARHRPAGESTPYSKILHLFMWTKVYIQEALVTCAVPSYTITSVLSVCTAFWKHAAPPASPLRSLVAPTCPLPILRLEQVRPSFRCSWHLARDSFPAWLLRSSLDVAGQGTLKARSLHMHSPEVTRRAPCWVSACPRNASAWVILETCWARLMWFILPCHMCVWAEDHRAEEMERSRLGCYICSLLS